MSAPADITFLFGCTGCGKAAVGLEAARRCGAEIISVDSMKIYRGMDVGTAKPSSAVRAQVPHHLIDIVDPWEEFSVAQYVAAADAALEDIRARGRTALAVGGTPLYIKAFTEGLFEGPSADPIIRARLQARAAAEGTEALHQELAQIDAPAAERIHPHDLRRIVRALEVYELTGTPISVLQTQWEALASGGRRYRCRFIGLRRELDDQNQRTNARVRRMIEHGLLDEVRRLTHVPRPLSRAARQAVGYAEILEHFAGRCSLDEAIERIKINTRQLAKSQRTWFKRFRTVRWIDVAPGDTVERVADEVLQAMQ
ncbi:MAG TPA: tRNA (adenosine(37)-N6)-dimethylallyltransferase MiaA [Phycisphaerae bacterium]|jgi:tRNA dimethylallyltransferase